MTTNQGKENNVLNTEKTKLRILMMAAQEKKEGESLLEAADRLMSWVSGGDKQDAANDRRPAVGGAEHNGSPINITMKPRVLKKPKVRADVDMAKKLLEGMIAVQQLGEKVTLRSACEITNLDSTVIHAKGAVAYLKTAGYVEMRGARATSVWRILKNPDGTPYQPTVQQCPTKEAKGYGQQKMSGFSSAGRTNAVMKAMSRVESAFE